MTSNRKEVGNVADAGGQVRLAQGPYMVNGKQFTSSWRSAGGVFRRYIDLNCQRRFVNPLRTVICIGRSPPFWQALMTALPV